MAVRIGIDIGSSTTKIVAFEGEHAMLSRRMAEIADENQAELILTTGGTGFSPRDVMPEEINDLL